MSDVFNEDDVRRFYKWLEHWPAEYTEVRIIGWPSGGSVIQRWVQDEEAFVELCREWSGKRQCYVGINPRSREGGSAGDVARVVAIPFDVDSKKPKKEAATDEELEQAKQRMIELVSWISIEAYERPLVAMSGNGYHVLQRVNLKIDDTLPSRLEAYFHEAPTEGMDSIFDLPRIIKIPGTMSVKGVPTTERPHRLSHILVEGNQSPDKHLTDHIADLESYTAPMVTATADAPVVKQAKRKTSRLKQCYKRFAEEGGRLASDDSPGSEDNLLRLALVTEAHSKGYSRDQIIELFSKCDDFDPKITREKVDHQLGKIAVEGIKPWSCLAIHKHGGCLGETCNRFKRGVAKFRPLVPPDPSQPASPDSFFDGRDKFVPEFLVKYIIENTGEGYIKTPRTKKGGDLIWWYNSKTGVFTDNGMSYLQGRIKQLLGDRVRNHMIAEVVKLVQVQTYIDREEFEEDKDILVLQNGVYHLDTEELTEYSPQYHAKSRWPITYNSDAQCPAILKFLDEVIPGNAEKFLNWVGYHFFKDYRWAVILMLVGDGENGKDILLTLLRIFLGGNNVSNVKLKTLVTDRFAASRLYGKLANIDADVGPEELKFTSLLKTITGNSWTGVQAKHFQGFDMLNTAKLSYATNKMPRTPDSSRAFHRRWLVMTCPNFFVKDATPEMAAQNTFPCDSNIIDKITIPQELSGLFNLALEGRRRLLREGGFDLGTVDERQKIYEELMDPIAAFLQNCVQTVDPTGVVPQDDFYRFYYQFCRTKGYTPILRQTFTKQLKPRIVNINEARLTIGSERPRCWVGVSMNPDKDKVACAKCDVYIPCVSSKRVTRPGMIPPVRFEKLVREKQGRIEMGEKKALTDKLYGKELDPPPDTDGLAEDPGIERSLVTASTVNAAIAILMQNDDSMPHQLLWKKLEFYGHTSTPEQDKLLRDDPRLIFAGITVMLKEDT